MSVLVSLDAISHEWPHKKVFDHQSLGIHEGDRVGIVGQNGDGKSTLLQIISGELKPSEGSVVQRRSCTVATLAQQDDFQDDESLRHAVVGEREEYEWAADARLRDIIQHLVQDLPLETPIGNLSGGQRRRCDLARVLIEDAELLLLDEPTNHLDMQTIRWLAEHLKKRWQKGQGALLVVTHDRWFLDEVCELTWEVHDQKIDQFEGGYSAYIQQRYERQVLADAAEARRQNTLRKELAWLARGPQARTSKPRFRIEAARALIAQDPPTRNSLELKRLSLARLGKQVISCEHMSFSYNGASSLFDDVDWLIGPGDRIGILGDNGAGKSTLLKLLTGRLQASSGNVKIGASVQFGWLSQQLDELEQERCTSLLEILERYKKRYIVDGEEQSTLQLAEKLGFNSHDLTKHYGMLSGGQKRRLALLLVVLEQPNVLVLDEPGNDLDTDMLAVLEDLLDSWPGTLIVVSHDRYLLERVCDDLYAVIRGKIRHLPGGVEEFLTLLKQGETAQRRTTTLQSAPQALSHSNTDSVKKETLSNTVRRDKKRRYESLGRQIPKLERELEAAKTELKNTDPTDYQALCSAQNKLDELSAQLEAFETEWLELADILE